MIRTSMIATLLLATAGATAAQTPPPSYAVRAAVAHLADGRTVEDCVLWVEGGKIRAVGRGVEPTPGTPVIEHPGSLSAGLVAAHAFTGGRGELTDPTRALLPEARLLNAYSPDHSDFERARAAGVTTVVLAPRAWSLAGGRTAVVKTAGTTPLRPEGDLYLSLHTTALWGTREPTSWGGALAALEKELAAKRGAFGTVQGGAQPVVIEAWGRHEVARALSFATGHGLTGSLRGAARAADVAQLVKKSGFSVIAGPFSPGASREDLRGIVALAEAGVPLAFGLDAPEEDPSLLRLSAALCVRQGLDPAIALQALTQTAAKIAGVGDRVGKLERGYDADFVLWSGPPLELTSEVVAVYVDGARVARAEGGDR